MILKTNLITFVSYAISERNFKGNPIVIGLTGHIGTGKTFITSMIANLLSNEGYSVLFESLAGPLKKIIQHYFCELKALKVQENDDFVYILSNDLEKVFPNKLISKQILQQIGFCKTWREKAQGLGSCLRSYYSPDIWVSLLIERLKKYTLCDFIIIQDLRYKNELELLKQTFPDSFISIRIIRPKDKILKSLHVNELKYDSMLNHESEKDIDNLDVDFEIENG